MIPTTVMTMLRAPTLREVSRARVMQDTPVMVSCVQVCTVKLQPYTGAFFFKYQHCEFSRASKVKSEVHDCRRVGADML